jgi:hypothetical protein
MDDLVRPQQQRLRDHQAERRPLVNDQLEVRGLLHGQVAGLGALQDLID